MMKYDFETCIDKRNSGSVKWRDMLEKQPDVPEGVVPLSVADMEFKTAPEITAGLKEYIETQALGYTEATDTYYDAVAGWMKDRHGWDVKREWIVTTPGIVLALGLAVRAFTQPGEGVIIMTPVYYPFYMVVEKQGRKLAENELKNRAGRYEIDFDGLEKKAEDPNNRMLLLCSPHNPVGRVWTREELARVSDYARLFPYRVHSGGRSGKCHCMHRAQQNIQSSGYAGIEYHHPKRRTAQAVPQL